MKTFVLPVFVIYLTLCKGEIIQGTNDDREENWVQRLYKDKMKGYQKTSRPVQTHTHNTTLRLALALNSVDLDDENQEMSVNAWTIMSWMDEFLRWVPADYMNIEKLHFEDEDIWMPDITIYNSADGADVHPFDRVPVLADYKGNIYWFPPTHMKVHCDLDLTRWPSDQHQCTIRMGSWSHHGEEIDIRIMHVNGTDGVMKTNLENNNRWELLGVEATRSLTSLEGHDPYVEVNFAFTLKRQASTHASYVTQATLALVVVVLASYFLPLNAFLSRLLMHLFALASLIACYYTLFGQLPTNGGPVPVVVRYFSGTIILTTVSLLSTILLTARSCSSCSSPSSSTASGLGSRLAGAVSPTRVLRNVMPQTSTQPYSHLETELALDEEEGVVGRPVPPRTTAIPPRAEEVKEVGVEFSMVRKVTNFLLLLLFTIAYVVDYVVLRSVAV